jgi:3-oxoacyl-[acyl-carrier protein] reductase
VTDPPAYLDRFRLAGRTALITGASRNIGAAIARAFAEAGADLVLNARGAGPLDAFADAVRQRYGVAVTAIAADLSQPADRTRLLAVIAQRDTGIDVLVNNATSGGRPDSGLETSAALWADAFAVNVTAPFELCRALVPGMRERGRGAVINGSARPPSPWSRRCWRTAR